MPAIFINPTTEEHLNLLNRLKEQNQDLRVFISDKIEKDYVEKLPGKKAIGDIYDDSHICLLYTSPSPRDISGSRMPSSA